MKSRTPQTISVIGAGIMGVMSAYTLQKHLPNTKITLIDRNGFPANNASFAAGGMIAPLSELDHMPHHYLGAGFDAIEEWENINGETEDAFEFANNGSLLIAHEADRHLLERFKSLLPHASKDWNAVNTNEIKETEPALNFKQGIHLKREAHLHPQKAMSAILSQIKNKETRRANPMEEKADWIIDCRGMAAKEHLTNLRGVKGETLIVHNPEFKLSRPVRLMHPRYPLYIVPREGDLFMIGATIIESDADKHISIRSGMELMSALYSLHKSFGDAKIIEMKAEIRPSLPDNLPSITIDSNIIHANGLYRHGFLFSPVMAQTIAHHIAGKHYEHAHLFLKEEKHENHFERRTANA